VLFVASSYQKLPLKTVATEASFILLIENWHNFPS
jgi:hypothetical protein